MEQTEKIWKEKRGAKSRRQSVLQRIDYQRGLTAQSPRHRHLVLYNAAGTNVSATYCDRKALNLPLLVEHKLYLDLAGNPGLRASKKWASQVSSAAADKTWDARLADSPSFCSLFPVPYSLLFPSSFFHLRHSASSSSVLP
jgi:hypothetical protein